MVSYPHFREAKNFALDFKRGEIRTAQFIGGT